MKQTGELSRIKALHRQQFDRIETEGAKPFEYPAGISTTQNLDIIRIEAEMQADGTNLKNPHMPAKQETLEDAIEMLENQDLEPAWLS